MRCVLSGHRLVWKVVGRVAAKPQGTEPAPAPEVPNAREGTACDRTGLESFPISGPLRCIDGKWGAVLRTDDSVATRAFRVLSAQYRGNMTASPFFKVVPDPRAPADMVDAIEAGLRAAARLWSLGKTPLQPYPVLIAQDSAWLRDKATLMQLHLSDAALRLMQSQEAKWSRCTLGAFHNFQEQPWFSFCFTLNADEAAVARPTLASLGAHEYTHLAEYALMGDVQGRLTAGKLTPWFEEGLAAYASFTLSDLLGASDDTRARELKTLLNSNAELSDYKSGTYTEGSAVYAFGFFAIEAFYALQGSGSVQKLLKACATGVSMGTALTTTTGRGLPAWTTLLSGYIKSLQAGTPMTLQQLQHAASLPS